MLLMRAVELYGTGNISTWVAIKQSKKNHRRVTNSVNETLLASQASLGGRELTFSGCWVNGDGVVEINLASPHLNSDSEALDDLVGTLTNDVEAHDPFFWTLHDELESGGFLVVFVDHAEVEGLEGSFIWMRISLNMAGGQGKQGSRTNLHSVSVLLSGLWLGQTDGSHWRMTVKTR